MARKNPDRVKEYNRRHKLKEKIKKVDLIEKTSIEEKNYDINLEEIFKEKN